MTAFPSNGTLSQLKSLMGLGSSVNSFSSFFSYINIWSKAKPKNSSYSEGIDAASSGSLTTIAQLYDYSLQGWDLATLPSSQEKLSAFVGYDHAIGAPVSGATVDYTHADDSSSGYFTVQVTFYQPSSNQVSIPDVVGSGCKMGVYCVKKNGSATHNSGTVTIGSYGSVTVTVSTTNWDDGDWHVYPYICDSTGTTFYTIPTATRSTITVTEYVPPTPVITSLSMYGYGGAISVGDSFTLSVYANYDDGTSEDITSELTASNWSFDSTILSRSGSTFTGIDDGDTYITVEYLDSTVSVHVYVNVAKTLSSISISNLPSSVNINSTFTPTVTAHWSDNTTSDVSSYALWSGYSSIASLNGTTFTGTSGGSATFTASYTSGGVTKTASQSVTVVALDHLVVTGYHNVKVGDSFELGVIAYYTDNSRENNPSGLSWSGYSSYFTRSGRTFTGSSVGDCTITVSYTKNGVTKTESISARCIKPITEIRIREYPSEDIADNPIYMELGDVIKLYAGVVPSDATIKGLSWSGGSGVFSIGSSYSAGGHNVRDITATGSGSGTLTVSATDGYGVTETRTINVYKYVTDVTLDESHLDLALSSGSTAVLTATITPSDANEWSTWEWKTSNSSVCTIVQNPSNRKKATVTAVGTGTTKVYLRIVSGLTTFRAECEVKVTQNPI